jgi:hypothetical protein
VLPEKDLMQDVLNDPHAEEKVLQSVEPNQVANIHQKERNVHSVANQATLDVLEN